MQLYGIVRRKGWASPEALQAAAERSTEVGDAPGRRDRSDQRDGRRAPRPAGHTGRWLAQGSVGQQRDPRAAVAADQHRARDRG
jgi:hypothetical protein